MSLSEIIPSSIKIDKLINRIEEGDIQIPAFQRAFVWDQEQIINLLDSIYKDYPIGSILLWNSIERLKTSRDIGGFSIPDREPQYPLNYVLDGQQRLTVIYAVIYAVFCKDRHEAPHDSQYNIDPSIFDIYFDLDDGIFLAKDDLVTGNTNLKLSSLFDTTKFYGEQDKLDDKRKNLARELQSTQDGGHPLVGSCQAQKTFLARKRFHFFRVINFVDNRNFRLRAFVTDGGRLCILHDLSILSTSVSLLSDKLNLL